MCDCDDSPRAFCTRTRTAAKAHRCCECHGVITKGEKYEYVSGIWDEGPNDFKTCAACVETRDEYIAQLTRYDCQPCFGDLFEGWPENELPPHVAVLRTANHPT